MSRVRVYFGDASDNLRKQEPFVERAPYDLLVRNLGAQALVFLDQVHGKDGLIIDQNITGLFLFEQTGDFIVTNQMGVAIGVRTADCVPLVCVDESKKVIAVVHAGWKGAVAGVIEKTLTTMTERFCCDMCDVHCLIGPCGGACCYHVSEDFALQAGDKLVQQFMHKNAQEHTFDLVGYATQRMRGAGILREHIDTCAHVCTICNSRFCSWRRKKSDNRNGTVVMLL